jgi:hypothetical protein
MIEIRKNDIETACSICGRTLLLGERLVTYHRPEGGDEARVCELCVDQAEARGWLREGVTPPPSPPPSLSRRRGLKAKLVPRRREPEPEPFEPEFLPEDPHDVVEAGLELFNESAHPRTVSGIARTLGVPRVSVVRRSRREVVVTVAWDLSWYQYRIDMLGPEPVKLQRRGDELDEIESRFCQWNAQAEPDGTLALAG